VANVHVPEERAVSEAITGYSPLRMAPEVWGRVEEFVRDVVRRAEPGAVYEARRLMNVVAQLAAWADRCGLGLAPEVVLHPDTIDRFVREACGHLQSGTQLNYRTMLREVGASVLGPDVYPLRPLPLWRSELVHPYSPSEQAQLLSWCRGLTTARYRNNIAVLLAVGLGAGLTSDEVCLLRGDDIVRDDYGVVIRVTRGPGREVPVLRRWEEEVAAIGARAGSKPVFLPHIKVTKRKVANFVSRCPRGDAPSLNMVRLRVTWLVHHISAGTNVVVLTKASGRAINQVVKYAGFAAVPDADEARRQLVEATVR